MAVLLGEFKAVSHRDELRPAWAECDAGFQKRERAIRVELGCRGKAIAGSITQRARSTSDWRGPYLLPRTVTPVGPRWKETSRVSGQPVVVSILVTEQTPRRIV